MAEFARAVLDSLAPADRERRGVRWGRANAHVNYPAPLQVGGGDESLPLRLSFRSGAGLRWRAPKCGLDYQSRISGPLFDRIDLHIDVARRPRLPDLTLAAPPTSEGSAEAWRRRRGKGQRSSKGDTPDIATVLRTNAEMEGEYARRASPRQMRPGRKLLTEAAERMQLSARGYTRVLKVARTIADLAGAETLRKPHVAEALSYRRLALL